MPARSEAQRRYLHWRFGAVWAKRHHFDTRGKLPERVKKHRRKTLTERLGKR